MTTNQKVTVEVTIQAPVEIVWRLFTEPEHVMRWNNASPDWHTPKAENNLNVGGAFTYRMEARDGSEGFDFVGTYSEVVPEERIVYTMDDGRMVEVVFTAEPGQTKVTETFDPENENPTDMQQAGWQAILDNFKRYVEEAA